MYNFKNGRELLDICKKYDKKIWKIMILREEMNTGKSYDEIFEQMKENLNTMLSAVDKGINNDKKSISGLVGGDAKRLKERYMNSKTLSSKRTLKATAAAMAVLEVNASMGQIVAAPTAGSSGILPGVIYMVKDEFSVEDDELVKMLFTASAIGFVIAKNATVSGADGGCQAETGSAAAMAAGALVELEGGTPEESLEAASMTIKNILGLVCDPIAGLVESPCTKRNAIGATNALISADMALAGIKSVIPFDEVVEAMYNVGKSISPTLKETALGGLAATPTGRSIAKKIFGEE
ncbi:L-serine ammonia-lyase, iron-sulfur-dependent, subunit alpha [Clostridium sp. D2Q-14]|uniref:L-serine ammonia-lyase, iron-sulfur-dependent, subunit alpha n=1 Tax=Anaeromonas gelatinilytica TaxID=2683194 RepID=UPI00193BE05F|nr:L-serine ammonia-lyase, iron-sulfur-dependent, subunit alpha [Anaeromonas gelatinilytica]MBS4535001.1 L-serine ammonia-lyase, iron-sulfur-dependent, subunit alpha [Anaeromonas gelatinilytica]